MNGSTQLVLRSTTRGRRWSTSLFPYPIQSCGEAELLATSRTSAVLIDSTSQFPVLHSADGGATWHDVGLPLLPGRHRLAPRTGPGGVTALPDGSLLLAPGQGSPGGWDLLRRGAVAWCRLRSPARAQQRGSQLTPVTVVGDRLWWLTGALPGSAAPTLPAVHTSPLSALSC